MRTPVIRKEQVDHPDEPEAQRQWYVIDAEGKSLGRVATQAAMMLRGKHKPTFTPHVDMGDFVIVVNAAKAALTGSKLVQKRFYAHSGWPGGLKERTAKQMLQHKPTYMMIHAVRGMLPKGRLGKKLLKKLKVYAGAEHPHKAQNPQAFQL